VSAGLKLDRAAVIAVSLLGACSAKTPGNAAGAAGAGGTAGAPSCALGGASGAGGAAGAPSPPACQSNPADYANPFQDPCAPLEDRITNLLSLLTSDEKQTLLLQESPTIPRLGIPAFTSWTEGIHGIGWSDSSSGTVRYLTGTQFPQAFGLAETWDPDALKTVGATTGYEARVYNAQGLTDVGRGTALVVRAPLVDLGRDPHWGRTEESYGEDPYLAGELAKGYIAGLQGDDPRYLQAASMIKHWLANNNEAGRATSSSNLDDRNLHEYYTVPFGAAMHDAHAQGLMTAYNQVNGTPAAVSPLIKSMLVGDFGFDGFVSTDATGPQTLVGNQHYYDTLEDAVTAIVQTGTSVLVESAIQTQIAMAVTDGLLSDEDLDAAARPLLRVRFRLGDFDPPSYVPYKSITGDETPWMTDEYKARALDVTRKSVVLLKNANGALPLDASAIGSVAVIGPRADSVVRDWYGGTAPYTVTPRQGIANKLPAATINYAADDTGGAATAAAAASDVALVFVGNHPTCGTPAPTWGTCPSMYEGREAVDRVSIALDPAQVTLVQSVMAANPRTIVVDVSSFPQALGWVNDNAPAIVHVTNSSQELGTAIADVLFGDVNPGGRTTMTWYANDGDIPTAITDYDIKEGTTYWYFTGTPLYPFGHGLSYTSFSYSNLSLSASTVSYALAATPCGTIQVGVDVANSGARAGDEVVQLYVGYPNSSFTRPLNQLRGFQRVTLAAGESRHLSFDLRVSDLTYWNADTGQPAVEPGMVDVRVGASSADVRLHAGLTVTP
jgi:beta-glucosidase